MSSVSATDLVESSLFLSYLHSLYLLCLWSRCGELAMEFMFSTWLWMQISFLLALFRLSLFLCNGLMCRHQQLRCLQKHRHCFFCHLSLLPPLSLSSWTPSTSLSSHLMPPFFPCFSSSTPQWGTTILIWIRIRWAYAHNDSDLVCLHIYQIKCST